MEGRLGLGCDIGQVSWSPWGGLVVSGVRLEAPEGHLAEKGIFRMDRVMLDVSWRSVLARKWRFERLEVEGVEVDVSVEMLATMMRRNRAGMPNLADGVGAEVGEPVAREEPRREEAVGSGDFEKEEEPGKEPGNQEVREPMKLVDDFEGEIVLREVSLRVYSEENEGMEVRMLGLSAEVPLWGARRGGEVRFEVLELPGGHREVAVSLPLEWHDSAVAVTGQRMKFLGLEAEVTGAVRLTQGLPFGVQVGLGKQSVDFSPLFVGKHSLAKMDDLEGLAMVSGYLMLPGSVRGVGRGRFGRVEMEDPRDGGGGSFERGMATCDFTLAGVIVPDFRLIGEEDAILLNGYALVGGEVGATVRVVSSPERAESHEKRINGVSPEVAVSFEPLVTPDREYRDFKIQGVSGVLAVDVGVEGGWVPLVPLVRAVLGKGEEGGKLP